MGLMSKAEICELLEQKKSVLKKYYAEIDQLNVRLEDIEIEMRDLEVERCKIEDIIEDKENFMRKLQLEVEEIKTDIKKGLYVDYSYAELESFGQMNFNYE